MSRWVVVGSLLFLLFSAALCAATESFWQRQRWLTGKTWARSLSLRNTHVFGASFATDREAALAVRESLSANSSAESLSLSHCHWTHKDWILALRGAEEGKLRALDISFASVRERDSHTDTHTHRGEADDASPEDVFFRVLLQECVRAQRESLEMFALRSPAVRLSSRHVFLLFSALQRCRRLKALSLAHCALGDDALVFLDWLRVSGAEGLTHLDLRDNALSPEGVAFHFARTLRAQNAGQRASKQAKPSQKTKRTNVSAKTRRNERSSSVHTQREPSSLRWLDLSHNALRSTGLDALGDLISDGSLSRCETLLLRNVHARASDVCRLCETLSRSQSTALQVLDLSGNQLFAAKNSPKHALSSSMRKAEKALNSMKKYFSSWYSQIGGDTARPAAKKSDKRAPKSENQNSRSKQAKETSNNTSRRKFQAQDVKLRARDRAGRLVSVRAPVPTEREREIAMLCDSLERLIVSSSTLREVHLIGVGFDEKDILALQQRWQTLSSLADKPLPALIL